MSSRNIADTLLGQPRFSLFHEALRRAGIESQLRSGGAFTIFAPIDSAFGNLDADMRASLAQDEKLLRTVVEYHLLRGALWSKDLRHGGARTISGASLRIGATDDGFTVDHANVVTTNIHCSNGIIHAIDAVIIPGYQPPVAAGARDESAWSGRRRVPQFGRASDFTK